MLRSQIASVGLVDRRGGGDAGVGDQDVERRHIRAAAWAKAAMTAFSSVTSMTTLRTWSLPKLLAKPACGLRQRRLVDIGQHDAGAFAQQPRGDGAADAAGAAGDQRDAAGQRFRLRHALQLRFFQQPVFDVEGFLLRQADIGIDQRRAAHHVDGVDIELAGDARGRLVLGEGDHADARHQIDHRVGIAHRRAVGALAAVVVGGIVGAIGGDQPVIEAGDRGVEVLRRPDRTAPPAARSWCAGNGPGRRCPSPPASAGRVNSRTPARPA